MSHQEHSAVVFTTVQALTPTPSGRFVRVRFTPMRVPGAYARNLRSPYAAPVIASIRMSLKTTIARELRVGEQVQLTVDKATGRPAVALVLPQTHGVRHEC